MFVCALVDASCSNGHLVATVYATFRLERHNHCLHNDSDGLEKRGSKALVDAAGVYLETLVFLCSSSIHEHLPMCHMAKMFAHLD